MNEPRANCPHHEGNTLRILRNERDIQDIWKKLEALDARFDKLSVDVAKIVGVITALGAVLNWAVKL